jgi:hypothetical protein
MDTQRELSRQIVEAGGDYLWLVKDNQPRTIFVPGPKRP